MQNATFSPVRLLLAGGALAFALAGCAGDDGKDGTSCSVLDNGNGTKTISCTDGTHATVTDGDNGAPGVAGTSCSVRDNNNGTKTITCNDGTSVIVADGAPGGNVNVANFHGEGFLLSTGEYAEAGKRFVNATITSATADEAGVVTVNFKVMDAADKPVLGLTAVQALIAKLVPGANLSPSRWVDYIQRVQTVADSAKGNWPNPDGTKARQGTREGTGTLTEVGNGEYTYRFATNLSNVTVGGVAIPYERNLTHRVQIMMGGHSGPTAEATYDFVPAGGAVTTRDIVQTSACTNCHGVEFHGHGGDRLTMPGCVTCHSSDGSAEDGVDPHGGQSIDMTVMTHKIHAGGALPTAPGPDGVIWDDPATAEDESADNVEYAIWGNSNRKIAWGKAEFPAMIENCTACHRGDGANADNWKTQPSRKACGSCHDDVVFGDDDDRDHVKQTNDLACAMCHPAEGKGPGQSVVGAHDFTKKDMRNIPEFDVELKVSTPPNGKYFVTGDTPVVTVVLKKGGVAIDHTTVVEDPAGEGCGPVEDHDGTHCTQTPDGLFRNANMYVTGPRAKRVPALSSAARAKVIGGSTGPWDLSAGGATLRVVVDSGNFIVGYDPAREDRLISGDFTVKLPAAGAALNALFVNPAAVTVDELVAWLMSDAASFEYNEREFHFRDRAIAYKDEATGRLALRSRPTIANTNILVPELAAAPTSLNQVLFTDHMVKVTGGAVQLRARTNPANNDPKAVRTAANIQYTLDPIDAYLASGTYVVNVEFADLGRGSTSDNYRTPSVAVTTFQVKQEKEELPIAANCNTCHWSSVSNTGYVLDFPRHNKVFNAQAMDQCGGCHDYASSESTMAPTWTTGSSTKPISRRVHSIHNGAALNNPVITVDHEESVPGRNWNITYPMDVRNCESCHPAETTSGTWMTNPNRIACMGCHDSSAAVAHMKLMTYDPTPAVAWSGDEEEACKACH